MMKKRSRIYVGMLIGLLIVTVMVGAIAENLENWPQSTERFVALSPSMLDIDNDGDLELVASDESSIYVWNHDGTLLDGNGDGIPDWPQQVSPYGMYFAPALADIDDDGDFEIFIGGSDEMSGLHHDGAPVDGWPFPITAYTFQTSPSIGDIDNDGDLEIVCATKYPAEVYVWNHDGTLFDGWPKTLNADTPKTIALADLDGDNDLEIILNDGMYIYIWNHNGTAFDGDEDGIPDWPFIPQPWGQQIPGYPGTYYNNPMAVSVGDVDRNGNLEIVLFTYNYAYYDECKRIWIHVFNSDGTEYDGFPIEVPYLYGWHRCGITLADIDDDSYLEMIVPTITKLIIVRVNGSYSLLPEKVIPDAPDIGMRGSIVADIDGDDDMEILSPILLSWDPFSSDDDAGIIYAWHHNGSEVLGFPKELPGSPSSMLSINDLDQDGDIELAGGYEKWTGEENENGVYVLDLEGPYNPNKVEWGTFAHDVRNTGLYNKPPDKPRKPSGPTSGRTCVEYIYTTSTVDPDGNQVYYKWDWGGSTFSDWLGPYESGITIEASHIWNSSGQFQVRVKAKDIHEAESDWSDPLEVTISEDNIEITDIKGGIGVRAVIKNIGTSEATDVEWSISIDGKLIILGGETNGTIDIPAGEEVTISSGLVLGLGKAEITVIVDEEKATADAFVLLFFVIIK